MTYAESCARWIEAKRAEEAEWKAAQPTDEWIAAFLYDETCPPDFLEHPAESRALYDAIVRERGE